MLDRSHQRMKRRTIHRRWERRQIVNILILHNGIVNRIPLRGAFDHLILIHCILLHITSTVEFFSDGSSFFKLSGETPLATINLDSYSSLNYSIIFLVLSTLLHTIKRRDILFPFSRTQILAFILLVIAPLLNYMQ